MNKVQILILALISTSSMATASEQCSKLFQDKSTALTTSANPRSESLPAVISESTYNMIVAALKRDIDQDFKNPRNLRADAVQQMLKIGISREEVAAYTREGIKNELQEMAKVTPKHFELSVKVAPKVAMVENVLNAKISIDEFIEYHNMHGEIAAVTKILNYRDSSVRGRANPIEVLKMAILTGQKDLAREAFVQSFRFNNIRELVELGIETGNNEILLNIGRISTVKFLKFDRNSNYFNEGLVALLEVKGPEKKQAEAMLLDLVDILKSDEIFKNEDSVANFGVRGNKAQYLGEAMSALFSASTLTGRIRRDSVSYHRFVETRDPRILDRIREIIKMGQNENSGLGVSDAFEGVAILKDPAFAKSIANHHLKVRFKPAHKDASEVIREKLPSLHGKHAVKMAFLTGDMQFIKDVIKEIFENDPMDTYGMRSGIELFSQNTIILKSAVDPSRIVRLLGQLAKDKSLTPGQLSFLNYTRKHLIKDLKEVAKKKPNLDSNLFINPNVDLFRHHKDTIQHSLGNKDSGFKAEDGLWSEYIAASNEQSIQKLKIVYNKMMTGGRGLDAVYVAFTIAVLEKGGDMSVFKALESGSAPLQIENN